MPQRQPQRFNQAATVTGTVTRGGVLSQSKPSRCLGPVPASLSDPASCEHGDDGSRLEPLPLTRETRRSSQLLYPCWPSPGHPAFWEVNRGTEDFSLAPHLSLSLSPPPLHTSPLFLLLCLLNKMTERTLGKKKKPTGEFV